jgi:hypothetical protein
LTSASTEHQTTIKDFLKPKPIASKTLQNVNDDEVVIMDVKEQDVCHVRKILYSSWFINPTEWLTNGHIDVIQSLIYENYKYNGFTGFIHPSRLEPALMGRDFVLNPETIHDRPFITILNAGKNHWITLTNYNPHYVDKNETGLGLWFIYDSLNNQEYYANSIKPALKRLNVDKSNVVVMACDMPKQYGSNDCGLFALAYAIAICMEKNPAKLIFEQISMRNHFNQVLKSQNLQQFNHFEIENTTLTNFNEYCIDVRHEELRYNFVV